MKEKLLKVKFTTWNGGKKGKGGEYIAIIKPRYFANGNIKKSDFAVVKILETIKKEYRHSNANHTQSIKQIYGEVKDGI